ncbi:unnamed protein product [Leuciscus chuanchicus]
MRPIFSASQRHDELNCQSELGSAEGARDLEVEYNVNSGSWQAGGRGQLSQPSVLIKLVNNSLFSAFKELMPGMNNQAPKEHMEAREHKSPLFMSEELSGLLFNPMQKMEKNPEQGGKQQH